MDRIFLGELRKKISCSGQNRCYFEIAHHEIQLLLCRSMPGNALLSSIQLPEKLNRKLLLF